MEKLSKTHFVTHTARPLYLGGILYLLAWCAHRFLGVDFTYSGSNTQAITSSGITLSAIVLGFIGTGLAVMCGLKEVVIERLKESGVGKDIAAAFSLTAWLSIAFCVFNFWGLFENTMWCYWMIWGSLGASMMYGFWRLFTLFFNIFI